MSDLRESLTQSGTLYGFINTIVYVHDYNDLSNKPQINGVTLQGNKTPSDLGLVTPATEAVQSVNGETGAVVLDGNDIAYDNNNTINQQIDAVAASIPVMAVTSVNGETGDVVLDDSDIEHSSGVSVNSIINTMVGYIPVYGNTASGAIATFDTSLALPLQDLQIAINAVQESGTPTPSSPKAINGFTGANIHVAGSNLWDEEWELGSINVSDGTNVEVVSNIRSKNYIPCEPNKTYYFIRQGIAGNIFEYDENHNFIQVISSPNTFTTTASTKYLRFYMSSAYGTTYQNNLGINYPSTDTTYHPYNGQTYTIAFGQTVYGGSLDVTSGVLTDDYSDLLDLDNLSWGYNSNYGGIFYAQTSASHTKGQAILCDCYKTTTISIDAPNTDWTSVSDLTMGLHYQGGVNYIYVKNSNYTDAVAFTSAMAGHKYITAIDNANTYQLTPTQISAIVGTNNVFTDTNGDTTLEYYTNKTVKDAINEVNDKADTNATAIGDLSTLTTTDKSSLVGAVNEKAKITRKKYSVTLASNTYVSPFTYFARVDIGSDTIAYGAPIGVWANNASATPHIENSNSIGVLGGSAITCDIYVFFASNVDVIS